MSQWAEIRHQHLVEGVAKKQIARRLQLDIKTVRRAVEQPRLPVYHDRVAVAVGAEVVAQHPRAFRLGAKVLEARHVLPLLERKHRAVPEATALRSWRLAPVWQQVPGRGRRARGRRGASGPGADRRAHADIGGLGRAGEDGLMAAPIAEPPHLAADLKTLCLSTITAPWRPLAEQATRQRQAPADYLAQLAHLEVTGRRERRLQRRMQEARFPMLKTRDAFSFDAQPDLDRDAVLQVFGCGFVAEAANIVLVGGVGTGKTHLAIALGMACCQHDYRVP